jgi:hypothetical protein
MFEGKENKSIDLSSVRFPFFTQEERKVNYRSPKEKENWRRMYFPVGMFSDFLGRTRGGFDLPYSALEFQSNAQVQIRSAGTKFFGGVGRNSAEEVNFCIEFQ